MWFAGALQWQTLFNFRDIREKLRGQDHSCTETNRQISEYLCSGSGKVGNNKVSFIICCIYMHIYCCLGFFFFSLELNYEHFSKGFGFLTSCVMLSSVALPF